MKNLAILLILSVCFLFACQKETPKSQNLLLLTGHTWTSDSLLVNKLKADDPGGMLEKFKGDMKFEEGGTGTFGQYTGTWWFSDNETDIVIVSAELLAPMTTNIVELKTSSLKITTIFPNLADINHPFSIRMTFKPK